MQSTESMKDTVTATTEKALRKKKQTGKMLMNRN